MLQLAASMSLSSFGTQNIRVTVKYNFCRRGKVEMTIEIAMFWGGLFGVWLAGASVQKFIDSDFTNWKYLVAGAFEGSTGIVFVLQSV